METVQDRWAVRAAKIAIIAMVLVVVAVVVLNSDIGKSAQQFTNTNMAAPFSALGFLAGAATLLIGMMVATAAWVSGHKLVTRCTASVVAIELILYVGLLVGYSSLSKEVALAPGAEKYFCELDCHIAYTVTTVRRDPTDSLTYHITLRTRFDEHTIAPWRGDAPLTPNGRRIELTDGVGHHYAAMQVSGTPLSTPLRPGQSYVTDLIFHLPQPANRLQLDVLSDNQFPERVMIGNENSFFHKKVAFDVPADPKG